MAISPNPIPNFNQSLAAFLSTYGVQFDNEKEEFTENPNPWDWGNLVDCLWQTQWEHNRGDGNTVKGVAGGSRTGTADIALADGEFLVNRGGTLQGDVLQPDDFDDTVHGDRSGGTLHDEATGAAAGFMSAADKTKLDGIESGAQANESATVYEVNFAALATNAFADGSESIDGRTWTVANTAAAGSTWGIVNGSGLVWTPVAGGAGTLTFSLSTQSAAYLYISLGDLLGSAFDPAARHSFEFVYSITVSAAEATRMAVGWWRPSGLTPTAAGSSPAQLRTAHVQTVVGPTQLPGIIVNSASISPVSATNNVDLATYNVLGFTVDGPDGKMTQYAGTYSGGWGQLDSVWANTAGESNGVGIHRADTRLVISSSMNRTATPASTFTISRMRVRKLR